MYKLKILKKLVLKRKIAKSEYVYTRFTKNFRPDQKVILFKHEEKTGANNNWVVQRDANNCMEVVCKLPIGKWILNGHLYAE